ncbi:MAG: hypothetical protein ACREV8_03535 [Gammaproteobacteria bacterium]
MTRQAAKAAPVSAAVSSAARPSRACRIGHVVSPGGIIDLRAPVLLF